MKCSERGISGNMAGRRRLEGEVLLKAKRMLRDVADILDAAGIGYILEAGTLLGIVRENRLLPWDNDVDITITDAYENRLLRNRWRFWLKGYRFYVRRYKRDTGPFRKGQVRIIRIQTRRLMFIKDLSLLDIFIKRLIGDEYYWTVDVIKPVLKATPRHFYDETTVLEFEGKKYSVPKNAEDYLAYHYGKNWRIPVKKWNFRTDDFSVREILD